LIRGLKNLLEGTTPFIVQSVAYTL